jgi:molybdopterin-containing oxidoreductase family iron-sulfur binding subunit
LDRREALKRLGLGSLAAAGAGGAAVGTASEGGADGPTMWDVFAEYFQEHYLNMSPEEVQAALTRLERKYKARYGVDVEVANTPAIPGVVFGYALNLSRCKGYRECVRGCIQENNQTHDSQISYIRVLEMDSGSMDFERADPYFEHEVPKPGKWYLPVQCQHCENAPCIDACPTEATWKEPDGIVVVDYNWCIGCRYCMTACPYWARYFNWADPVIPAESLNPKTHYLGNRPRPRGVVEKCTFCIQRTRLGRMPACQEACPTGARVFGNLLDPNSEIRQILATKRVFRLKEDLNTEPKFWYYTD